MATPTPLQFNASTYLSGGSSKVPRRATQKEERPRPPVFVARKLPTLSTKFCPDCFRAQDDEESQSARKLVKRTRSYTITGPLNRSACDKELRVHKPRIDYGRFPWTLPGINWLFAAPSSAEEEGWYECRMRATCPHHGTVVVKEQSCIRQFSRFRRAIIWVRATLFNTFDRVIPIR